MKTLFSDVGTFCWYTTFPAKSIISTCICVFFKPNIDFFDGALGIHAASNDVIEKEIEESETRLSNIAPIMPIVYAYCALIKDASTAAIVEEMNAPEEQKEAISAVINKFAMGISLGAATGILSQLVDHGFVNLNVRKK